MIMADFEAMGTNDFCGSDTYPFAARFWETKKYLHRVRDGVRKCALLKQRIELRKLDPDENIYADTDELEHELNAAEQMVNEEKIKMTDLISRLPDVNQQMVITQRYVNLKTWDQIADEMHTNVRIVQKIHGKALPALEKMIGVKREETDNTGGNETTKLP